ncbi:DUF559 domain-containing protein [Modestobacter sp. SYSU DS0290]
MPGDPGSGGPRLEGPPRRRLHRRSKDPSAPHRSHARGGPLQRGRSAKLAGNVQRDRRTDAVLTGLGWRVLRFWEHEDPDAVVDRICAALRDCGEHRTPAARDRLGSGRAGSAVGGGVCAAAGGAVTEGGGSRQAVPLTGWLG